MPIPIVVNPNITVLPLIISLYPGCGVGVAVGGGGVGVGVAVGGGGVGVGVGVGVRVGVRGSIRGIGVLLCTNTPAAT